MPALTAVALGIALGLACGGTLGQLSQAKLRFEAALILMFLVQAFARGRLPFVSSGSAYALPIWVFASCACVAILLLNMRVPGMAIAAAGLLLNLDAVLLNGAMPALVPARAADASASKALSFGAGFYQGVNPATHLPWLGDVLSISVRGATYLLSAGDVALAIGVLSVIVWAMSREARGPQQPSLGIV